MEKKMEIRVEVKKVYNVLINVCYTDTINGEQYYLAVEFWGSNENFMTKDFDSKKEAIAYKERLIKQYKHKKVTSKELERRGFEWM
jgi:hypothetical protein